MAKSKSANGPTAERSPKVRWKPEPEEHDYPAAASYLSLIAAESVISRIVGELRAAPVAHFKAKDILRAARLELLPPTNAHVAADLASVHRRQPLSPILLVRGDLGSDAPLQIADGYHRVCASYHINENTPIPCRLSTGPGSRRATG